MSKSPRFDIDVAGMAAQFKEFAMEAEREFRQAVAGLAAMTHAHVAEEAKNKLHTSFKTFKDNLGFVEITPGIWVVSIDDPALWIEEGIEPGKDMKPDLLKDAAPGANGSRSKVIHFDHANGKTKGAGPDNTSQSSQSLDVTGQIRRELAAGLKAINRDLKTQASAAGVKFQNITIKGIEKDSNGSPRVGKLHEFNLPSDKPTATSQHPALKGLTIYQTKRDDGSVRRDVLTFRTVSDNSDPQAWHHPGYKGQKFLEEAETWARNEWDKNILPLLMDSLNRSYK